MPHVSGAYGDCKRISDPLEQKLWVFVSHQHGCWHLNSGLEKQESLLVVEVSLVPELAFSIAGRRVGGEVEVNEGFLEEVSFGFL